MKTRKLVGIFFLTISILFSCTEDDNSNTVDPEGEQIPDNEQTDLQADRETSINALTNTGEVKTWKIDQAVLTNNSGSFDISENFNVQDDEFRFSGGIADGNLEWRQNHRINTEAASVQESLVDHYLEPENFSFSFETDSSSELISFDENFTFEIIDDNTINGRINFEDTSGELEITLSEKTATDFPSIPTSMLNFESISTYFSNNVQGNAPGMIGSYSDNSLFIVTREDALNNGEFNPERVNKFNLSSNQSTERLFFNSDFVSKQLHIIDNQLLAVGGQFINGYDLALENEPNSINHGIEHTCSDSDITHLGITRHGMAVQDDDIYIIGGSFANFTETNDSLCEEVFSNIIYKWNISTQTLSESMRLPNNLFGARGTIVNNNLYVFGGQQYFFDGDVYDTIYIIDLDTGELVDTLNLPSPIQFSFVDKFDSLIYVAGQNEILDDEGIRIAWDSTLGVFDTNTNTFTVLQTNLTQENPFDAIHQMCIFNNDLYILYGSPDPDNDPDELDPYTIMRVPIN